MFLKRKHTVRLCRILIVNVHDQIAMHMHLFLYFYSPGVCEEITVTGHNFWAAYKLRGDTFNILKGKERVYSDTWPTSDRRGEE
jgi:hypothetical protein